MPPPGRTLSSTAFNGYARRIRCIVDAVLILLDLGGPAAPGHRDPTSRLDDTLLQLFATLVAGGHFDLGAKLSNPRVNIGMPSVPKALTDNKDGDDFTPFTITASHAATAPGRHSCGGTSKES